MRGRGEIPIAAGILFFLAGPVFGQSVVEYSTATASGTTGTAASSQGISKSIGGIFGNLNKALDGTNKPGTDRVASGGGKIVSPPEKQSVSGAARHEMEAASAKRLPPEEIRVGINRSELTEKFGPPFMKTSRVEGVDFVESYYYHGTDDLIVVTIREGMVSRISPPPAPAKAVESASAK